MREHVRVSVIGGGSVPEETASVAREVGRTIAERSHTVVCGGLGGVMAAACRGAKAGGGDTIGILPGEDRATANPHVDVAIATGMGHARNVLVVLNGDAVVAVDGGPGTLSEMGFAAVYDRPAASIGAHDAPGFEAVDSAEAAVRYVESEATETE